jgi:hypothetical protein
MKIPQYLDKKNLTKYSLSIIEIVLEMDFSFEI